MRMGWEGGASSSNHRREQGIGRAVALAAAPGANVDPQRAQRLRKIEAVHKETEAVDGAERSSRAPTEKAIAKRLDHNR